MDITNITPIVGGNVSSISPLWGNSITDVPTIKEEEQYTGAAFIDILTSAVENVAVTDAEKNQMEYLLAVGELDNPAELTIATTKAQVAVELLTKLRTSGLEAYNELIRISI